ncbi:hypothetical protein QE152_g23233 [Popillia japonica]|uniref:Uncharacterized protein n=1 Tax=Popillia japonica TaxID=7064 RepID=A0AAW1KIE7_POPJA
MQRSWVVPQPETPPMSESANIPVPKNTPVPQDFSTPIPAPMVHPYLERIRLRRNVAPRVIEDPYLEREEMWQGRRKAVSRALEDDWGEEGREDGAGSE